MKSYELTYIITPEISSEEAEATAKEVEAFLQSLQGTTLKYENPVPKVLAYRIKKQGSGFMGVLEFQMPEENIAEFKEKLRKDSKILRHLLTVKNPVKAVKERKLRTKPLFAKPEEEPSLSGFRKEEETPTKEEKPKVELRDIEEKLDEILSE